MDRKSFTILVTSNRKGKTQTFSVSAAWVKAFALITALILVILGAGAVDYVGLLLEAGENKRLRAENAALKQQFDIVESKVTSLETSLERVKNYSTKLKLITNIEDQERSLKLSIGPMPKPGQNLEYYNSSLKDRAPTSEFLTKEDVFVAQPPLDEAKGELARHAKINYASLSIRIDRAVKDTELREQGVLELYETLSERQNLLNATPSIRPARGWYTSKFGYRIDPFTSKPVMHAGIDIAAPPGTPVYAPADGVVSYVGYESGYGKLVSIDHGYGVTTRFAHNSQTFVDVGQKLSRFDVISAIGTTGRSSGPHLHYEIRVHGVPVDPMNYILTE